MITPDSSPRRLLPRFRFLTLGLLLAACTLPAAAATEQRKDPQAQPYALIFGTVYGPDERPLYGVPVKCRRADQKKAKWELTSDHRGEFALRVPAGAADYVVWTDVDLRKLLKALGREDDAASLKSSKPGAASAAAGRQAKVHVDNDERVDISLHLTE